MDINTSELDCLVQKYEELLTSTADTLWDYAETAYQEIKSCTLLKKHLCSHGFTLLPTSPAAPHSFRGKVWKRQTGYRTVGRIRCPA